MTACESSPLKFVAVARAHVAVCAAPWVTEHCRVNQVQLLSECEVVTRHATNSQHVD